MDGQISKMLNISVGEDTIAHGVLFLHVDGIYTREHGVKPIEKDIYIGGFSVTCLVSPII